MTSVSFSQNLAVNGDMESFTGGVIDTWTSESGTTITQETTTVDEGSSAANFEVTTQSQGDTDFRQSIAVEAGKVYDVSFRAYQVDNGSRARLYADGFENYSDETILGAWQTVSFEYTATATASVEFGLRFYDISANWTGTSTIIIDDYRVEEQVGPSMTITAPADNALVYSTDVDVELAVQNFTVANGTGDGYIVYNVDGGSDVNKFDTNPINLTSLAAGQHTVFVKLVDNGGADLTSPVEDTVTFSVVETQTLPYTESFDYTDTEALAAQAPWTNYFSGDDVVVSSGSLSYSTLNGLGNSISFDGSGADPVVDYTATSSGTIYASFMLNISSLDAMAQNGYFAVLRTDGGSYEARIWISPTGASTYRIGLSNGGTLTQIDTTDYDLTTDTVFVVFSYDIDGDVVNAWINPTLGGSEPAADLTEASTSSGNTFSQFLIRQDSPSETPGIQMDELRIGVNWTDVTPATLSNSTFETAEFKLYPNPNTTGTLNINASHNGAIDVQVFDVLGKRVINTTLSNNTVDVSGLNSGLYIVKLTQNNTSTTNKLVIE